MFEDRGDIDAHGAVDAACRPSASNFHLGQRGLVVDLDLSRMSLRCTNVQDGAFICRHVVDAEARLRVVLDYFLDEPDAYLAELGPHGFVLSEVVHSDCTVTAVLARGSPEPVEELSSVS